MLVACIVVKMLITATVAYRVNTKFKLTFGEKIDGIVKYVAKETSNSESVGLRISSSDRTVEPLTYDWMENRNYETGYSYYEKIYVDEEFEETKWNGDIRVKIQGPLTSGSTLSIKCSASTPFTRTTVNLLDQRYLVGSFPFDVIRFTVDFRPGGVIVYNWRTAKTWQYESRYNINEETLHGELDIELEVESDSISGTVFGEYPRDISQTSPGDTPTTIEVTKQDLQPILHRLVYKKGN